MLSKEVKHDLCKLVDVKNKLDADLADVMERAKNFNDEIKKLTGKDNLDWSELVKMLCEVGEDD
jgi:hypothetical protein